jgi:hypothetical protein
VGPERSFADRANEKPRQETDVINQERAERTQPQQNPQVEQTTETLLVNDSGTPPTYSNFCRVTATPEEAILDFGLNPQPFLTGSQEVKASQRIVISYYTAKRLSVVLVATIQRHEQAFGTIELDVRRRTSMPQNHRIPAETSNAAEQPEATRLNR